MTALHGPATFYRGNTWEILGELRDADGDPLDLTSAAVEWKVEDSSGATILDLSIGSGIQVTDILGGKIVITVTPTQSTAINAGTYKDELRVTDQTGAIGTQWIGSFSVKDSFFVSP
jgi:hypothetical protein